MRLLIALCLVASGLTAQTNPAYLYIMRKGEVPAQRLTVGDVISVKQTETDWYKNSITAIDTDRIQVGNRTYFLSEIEAMRTYNELGRIFGQAMMQGSLLIAGIGVFNGLVNEDDPVVYPRFLYWMGGIFTGGAILNWLSRKTYKVEKNWYFEVIDFNSNTWEKQQQ